MRSGKILHFIRCGPPSPMYPMNDGRASPKTDDSGDRAMLCDSSDGGRSWEHLRDFGDYGLMYPRVLRLHDGRTTVVGPTQRHDMPQIGRPGVVYQDDMLKQLDGHGRVTMKFIPVRIDENPTTKIAIPADTTWLVE